MRSICLFGLCLPLFAPDLMGAESTLHFGSGCKAGEISHNTAIVHVRLTTIPKPNKKRLLPGKHGFARVTYGIGKQMTLAKKTEWKFCKDDMDYSVQFSLADLKPATRYYYSVEAREEAGSDSVRSKSYSFQTAPAPGTRGDVVFQVTTGQDLRGIATYRHMQAQKPHFLVSTGDNVYYDSQTFIARNVKQAYQCYQHMYGDPIMVEYFRHIGGYFEKDDHDYRFNDSDPYQKGKWFGRRTYPGAAIARRQGNRGLDVNWLTHEDGISVFKRVWPMSKKTYRTFRWGDGVQIWLLEGRDFRSPNAMPDGPDKTIWGKEQKAWLKKTLLESKADWKVIISPTPIIGPDRTTKRDNHANPRGFRHEGQAFLDWIKTNKLNNVVLSCGDRHWQYHSIDPRGIHEFSCGPTCDEHTQKVPKLFEGYKQPYAGSIGGFLQFKYASRERALRCEFFDENGKSKYTYTFKKP